MNIKLTVFLNDGLWIGVFEQNSTNGYEVAKILFGTEPSNQEVFEYISTHYNTLRFSRPIENDNKSNAHKINPKRLQRLVRKETQKVGIGTKAQNTLKLEQEKRKRERKSFTKLHKEQCANIKYILHHQKKKEKHKGH